VEEALYSLNDKDINDDEVVRETARMTVRRALRESFQKRPVTKVNVIRV
jgi:hypothetical protein